MILFIDLDGTLLNSQCRISDENKLALKRFRLSGGIVVICSARPIPSLLSTLSIENVLDVDYLVGFNGGAIYDFNKSSCLNLIPLEYNMVLNINRALEGFNYHAFSWDKLLVNNENNISKYTAIESEMFNLPIEENIIENEVFKFTAVSESEDLIAIKNSILHKITSGVEISITGRNYIDIQAVGVNKGRSVIYLSNLLNLSKERVISIGDSENDISMFKNSGSSFSMGNASNKVKGFSINVTTSNDNNGVANVIKLLI